MRLPTTIGVQILPFAMLATSCLAGAPSKHPKISSAILDAIASRHLQIESGRQRSPNSTMSLTPAGLQVYMEEVEVSESTLADLRALGVTIELTDPGQRLAQARVPPALLEAVASLSSVKFIRLPDRGVSDRQSSAGTEGDGIVRAHLLRRHLGATGVGVRILKDIGSDAESRPCLVTKQHVLRAGAIQ